MQATTVGNIWLADFFNQQREIIEAAETPFSKLAVFVLPILAPMVPAIMTGLHLYKLLLDLFDFGSSKTLSIVMASGTGIVLELLGYVGAVTFISSIFRFIRTKDTALFLRLILNGLAYMFYIVVMWAINWKLGDYFNFPPIVTTIFGLLSFVTVPTGLLAADHLSQRAEDDEAEEDYRKDEENDRKNMEFKLRKAMLKQGINPLTGMPFAVDSAATSLSKGLKASDYIDQMMDALEKTYVSENRVLKGTELAQIFGLDYYRSKGVISKVRREWSQIRKGQNS